MSFTATSSLFWLIIIAAISAGAAWFFYRKNDWLSTQVKWVRYLIPTLRGLGIFFLLVLLLELTLLSIQTKVEEPILITVIDNSSSIRHNKDSAGISNKIKGIQNEIKERFSSKYEMAFYTVGEKIQENGPIQLNENKSNLELAFNHIADQYLNRNIGGIILLSDGNYNEGNNPSYSAEKISLTPVFSIGCGDTIPKKDQIISNLYYNDVVFLKDKFPIEVDLEAFKIINRQVKVSLTQQGRTILSQTVDYDTKPYAFKQLSFEVTAEKIGFQSYTVSVEYLDGEFSKSNNSKTCYIEVVDTRNSLCFISNGVHPDIAALREVAHANENYESKFLSPGEMMAKGLKPDLVIWYHPTLNLDENVLRYIEQNKLPVLYIINPSASAQETNKLKLFSVPNSRTQIDEVQGSLNPGFNAFELSDPCKDWINYYPPLVTKFGSINPTGNSEILLYQRVGNAVKSDPLIYFGKSKSGTPYGVIYGEGVWKWKMTEFMKQQKHEHFNELFSKVYAYLMVKREGMGLSIQFDKRFGKFDRIGVNASFYNASLEPITTPNIDLKVVGPQGKKYLNRFNKSGNHYELDLGTMAPGAYNWTASCTYQGKNYSKKGIFVVEDISLEHAVNTANHGVLKQLAKNSGGAFATINQYKKLLDQIEKREDITTIERQSTEFSNLIDSWFYLLLIALSFGTEWFLKRYFGAY